MTLFHSLKLQIGAALSLIVLLFIGVFFVNRAALEEQRGYNMLLNITARLEHTARSIVNLGVNYAMNAPADHAARQRDIKVYYQELHDQLTLFDEITNSFMSGSFSPSLTALQEPFRPALDSSVQAAVTAVEETWDGFRKGVTEALGMDRGETDLTQAAAYITANHMPLNRALDALRSQIQFQAERRLERLKRLQWMTLATVAILTLGIFAWFFAAILRPLSRAADGFQHVAQGDFGYQVPVAGDNELGRMSSAFNQLSSRLHAVFRLIDRIQQGSDLSETLRFVAEEFPALLPLDWVGALFVSAEGGTIILERSYRNGKPVLTGRSRFRLHNTLLQQALENDRVLHIPDMRRTAENNPQYEFLNHMMHLGLGDAIFLPVTGHSPIPAVLAFATTRTGAYTREHLELLSNIAKLITHSFGRTVKLAEHDRLAAIGTFVSGIAHEIRSPLSTVTMALEHLERIDLPGNARKRTDLARDETHRITRLLDEILLYAKPLRLTLKPLEMGGFVEQFLTTNSELAGRREQRFTLERDTAPCPVMGDPDRLTQVLLNLANNAVEAAPAGGVIRWRLRRDEANQSLVLEVSNPGAIPQEALAHLFTPFFTSKPQGTGLGLPIVRRMVEAHGGDIRIRSGEETTRVTLQLPLS